MSDSVHARRFGVASVLLLLTACVFLTAAVLYNELWLAELVAGDQRESFVIFVRHIQICFLAIGLFFAGAAILATRVSRIRACADSPLASKLLLAGLVVSVPLVLLELVLRPLWLVSKPKSTTTIFMYDEELGWRLRPGSDDMWDGARAQINSKGLRGPEIAYKKAPGVYRILHLGDSVTFGDGIERYEETFPHRIGVSLEARLSRAVETVNAGVSGYSPWQHLRYLELEGMRFEPDLVLVHFVLNDVTEKLSLRRFGGSGEGYQLWKTVSPARMSERGAIFYYARRIWGRLAYGPDVRMGASRQEVITAESLAYEPDKPGLDEAWAMTLRNLDAIFSLCRDRGVAAALVVFPYQFQFEDPIRLSTPQRILQQYATERGIPVLDLLPVLHAQLEAEGRPAEEYFLDWAHLNSLGSEVVARSVVDFLDREGLTTPPLSSPPLSHLEAGPMQGSVHPARARGERSQKLPKKPLPTVLLRGNVVESRRYEGGSASRSCRWETVW